MHPAIVAFGLLTSVMMVLMMPVEQGEGGNAETPGGADSMAVSPEKSTSAEPLLPQEVVAEIELLENLDILMDLEFLELLDMLEEQDLDMTEVLPEEVSHDSTGK